VAQPEIKSMVAAQVNVVKASRVGLFFIFVFVFRIYPGAATFEHLPILSRQTILKARENFGE
jgi:hypothetical protein